MANYDYEAGKKRIDYTLKSDFNIKKNTKLLSSEGLGSNSAYSSLITAVFIRIKDYTDLLINSKEECVVKVLHILTTEVINILSDDKNYREIGTLGDCIYGIYSTPNDSDIFEVTDKTFYINTFVKMLNKMTSSYGLPNIRVGIGMASNNAVFIKNGDSSKENINNNVFVGRAVTSAAYFSSISNDFYNDDWNQELIYSETAFEKFKFEFTRRNPRADCMDWFEYREDEKFGGYYTANIVKTKFNKWINEI